MPFLGLAVAAVVAIILLFTVSASAGSAGVPLRRKKFADAIASAEGFGVPDAIPTLANNPGDLTKGDFGDTGIYTGPENIIMFPNVAAGKEALYRKLENIANGGSSVYSPDDSIRTMAEKYAPGRQSVDWSRNVAAFLGVTEDARIGDLI